MTDEEKRLALEADMDRHAAQVRDIGPPVTLSGMELAVLVNLARLACLNHLGAILKDDEELAEIEAEQDDFVACLDAWFTDADGRPGVARLVESCVALLGQDRIGIYVVPCAEPFDREPGEAVN